MSLHIIPTAHARFVKVYESIYQSCLKKTAEGRLWKISASQLNRLIDSFIWKSCYNLHPNLIPAIQECKKTGNTEKINEYFRNFAGAPKKQTAHYDTHKFHKKGGFFGY